MERSLTLALHQHSGLASRAELLGAGATADAIQAAWRSGEVLRVRHGLYAHPGLPDAVVRAARVGGVCSGASALGLLDLWEPPGGPVLHVSVRPHARALRDPDIATLPLAPGRADVRVHYDRHRLHGGERLHVGTFSCLRQVIDDLAPQHAIAVLDSALHRGHVARHALPALRAALPIRCRKVVDRSDGRSESGTESVMRWGLAEAGFRFEVQRPLPGGMRVDFLIAGRVVVECVSYRHHGSPAEYGADRERIAALVRLGYVVLEFTYHQVLFDWPAVLATITAAVIAG